MEERCTVLKEKIEKILKTLHAQEHLAVREKITANGGKEKFLGFALTELHFKIAVIGAIASMDEFSEHEISSETGFDRYVGGDIVNGRVDLFLESPSERILLELKYCPIQTMSSDSYHLFIKGMNYTENAKKIKSIQANFDRFSEDEQMQRLFMANYLEDDAISKCESTGMRIDKCQNITRASLAALMFLAKDQLSSYIPEDTDVKRWVIFGVGSSAIIEDCKLNT